jgi:hypothetical protein
MDCLRRKPDFPLPPSPYSRVMPPEPQLQATDTVALAVESHARNMEAQGYGVFSIRKDADEVVVGFGPVEVRGENCDLALLRLAAALLDNPNLSEPFLTHIRNAAKNPPAVTLRENQLTVRTAEGKQ